MPKINLCRNWMRWIVCAVALAAANELLAGGPDDTDPIYMPPAEPIPTGRMIAAPAVVEPTYDLLLKDAASQTVSSLPRSSEAGDAPPCSPQQQPRTAPIASAPRPGPLRALGQWLCCEEDCCEVPFGASVHAALRTQTRNGMAARMVLYQYDFCDDDGPAGDNLNPHGSARLGKLIRWLPCADCHPIVIECSQDPALDAARRARVVEVLCKMNIPAPEQLVVIGAAQTPALRGIEAEITYLNLLRLIGNQRVDGYAPNANGSAGGTVMGGGGAGR